MKNKYNNTKVECQGSTFDSKRERDRFIYLQGKLKEDVISNLELQPKYELIPSQRLGGKVAERAISYTADFQYNLNGKLVVEDVKISKKLLPKEFVLKRKMMLFFHGIQITEVYKATQSI